MYTGRGGTRLPYIAHKHAIDLWAGYVCKQLEAGYHGARVSPATIQNCCQGELGVGLEGDWGRHWEGNTWLTQQISSHEVRSL